MPRNKMKTIILTFIFILGIVGIYLLGSSITGFVISETCCFPPNCNTENQCQFGESPPLSSSLFTSIVSGTSLLIVSALLYGFWYRKIYRNSIVRKR